jgi:hypothetical protein
MNEKITTIKRRWKSLWWQNKVSIVCIIISIICIIANLTRIGQLLLSQ